MWTDDFDFQHAYVRKSCKSLEATKHFLSVDLLMKSLDLCKNRLLRKNAVTWAMGNLLYVRIIACIFYVFMLKLKASLETDS